MFFLSYFCFFLICLRPFSLGFLGCGRISSFRMVDLGRGWLRSSLGHFEGIFWGWKAILMILLEVIFKFKDLLKVFQVIC